MAVAPLAKGITSCCGDWFPPVIIVGRFAGSGCRAGGMLPTDVMFPRGLHVPCSWVASPTLSYFLQSCPKTQERSGWEGTCKPSRPSQTRGALSISQTVVSLKEAGSVHLKSLICTLNVHLRAVLLRAVLFKAPQLSRTGVALEALT